MARRSLLWAEQRQSRALFFAPVHMIMEAVDHPEFMSLLNAADANMYAAKQKKHQVGQLPES